MSAKNTIRRLLASAQPYAKLRPQSAMILDGIEAINQCRAAGVPLANDQIDLLYEVAMSSPLPADRGCSPQDPDIKAAEAAAYRWGRARREYHLERGHPAREQGEAEPGANLRAAKDMLDEFRDHDPPLFMTRKRGTRVQLSAKTLADRMQRRRYYLGQD
jgi:hypothetical protein